MAFADKPVYSPCACPCHDTYIRTLPTLLALILLDKPFVQLLLQSGIRRQHRDRRSDVKRKKKVILKAWWKTVWDPASFFPLGIWHPKCPAPKNTNMMQEKNKDERKKQWRAPPPICKIWENHKIREHRWKKNNQTTAMIQKSRMMCWMMKRRKISSVREDHDRVPGARRQSRH